MSKNYEDYFDPIVVTEFDREDTFRFRRKIYAESLSDKTAPIVVYIDSDGGDIDGLASMVATIKSVPNPIYTVCVGRACSAAAFLLSFGDKRYCDERATVMIHKLSAAAIGHLDDINEYTKELNRVNDLWLREVASNCGLTLRTMKQKLKGHNRDLYMSAQEAKDMGLIDEIGVPEMQLKLKGSKRRKRSNVKKKKTSKKKARR